MQACCRRLNNCHRSVLRLYVFPVWLCSQQCESLFCLLVSVHAQVCCVSGVDQEDLDRSSRLEVKATDSRSHWEDFGHGTAGWSCCLSGIFLIFMIWTLLDALMSCMQINPTGSVLLKCVLSNLGSMVVCCQPLQGQLEVGRNKQAHMDAYDNLGAGGFG